MDRLRVASIVLLLGGLLATAAVDVAHLPATVTAPPIQMTDALPTPSPTPAPLAHLPAAVTAPKLTLIDALPTPTPTPAPLAHLPAAVQAPPIQMINTGGH
jgi:hypothetical protein